MEPLDLSSFISADTGKPLQVENQPFKDGCGVGFCNSISKQTDDVEFVEDMMGASENLLSSVDFLTKGNIFVVLIAQGSFQQLWGVIRAAQLLLFQALVRHNYPVHTHLFYSVCLYIAEMDLFNAKELYAKFMNFNAADTPYNNNFDLYGVGDKNFLMNTGSLVLIFVLLIVHKLICIVLYVIGRRFFRYALGRKAGMYG